MGALHSLSPENGGMSSESGFFGPQFWRVHHIPDAHWCSLPEGWIRGVELGLGVVHGTLGGHLGADGSRGQDGQIVGHTGIRVLPCSHLP